MCLFFSLFTDKRVACSTISSAMTPNVFTVLLGLVLFVSVPQSYAEGSEGICAGCPMTQKVVNEEHMQLIKRAFQLVKERNPNVIIGVEAALVPDTFKTQVVAGTKFMFTLKTNAGENIKFTVFRSLPQWGQGESSNSGNVEYSVSEAVITSSVMHHTTDGGPNDLVFGPDKNAKRGPIVLSNLPKWTKSVSPTP